MPLCPVLDNYFFSHKSLYLQDASHCHRISTRHVHPSRQSRRHTALKHVMMFPILFPICSAHSQIWPSFLLFTEPYPLIIKLFKLKNTHKTEVCTALACIRLCEYLLGHTHTRMLPGRDRWPGSSLLSLPINSLPQRYPWFWFPSPQTSFAYPVFRNPIVCSTGFFCSTHPVHIENTRLTTSRQPPLLHEPTLPSPSRPDKPVPTHASAKLYHTPGQL